MTQAHPLHPSLSRIQFPALVVGLVALAACVLGFFLSRERFFLSYLFAYLFWFGLALGSFAILMLQHLTGGAWGLVIRRLLESAARMLPLMAILFLPLLLGMRHLYSWAGGPHVPGAHGVGFREWWLSDGFFLLRAIIYFSIWIVLSLLLIRWSVQQDRTGDPQLLRRFERLSGPGLVLYALTITFASIDWVMSLDPHWFSTIFGFLFIASQALSTIAFIIAVAALLARDKPLSEVFTIARFHDLGNLLLAFVMLWAYLSFAQYLIIWSGNLPEETPFYVYRTRAGWQWVALLLIVVHFFIPFILLLWRRTKKNVRALATVAIVLLFMRFVDLFWLVVPAYAQSRIHDRVPPPTLHWLDFAAPIGIGGIWIAVYIWQLGRHPLLPLHDPRLAEVNHHG